MTEKKIDGSHRIDVLAYFHQIEQKDCCYKCESYNRRNGFCDVWKDTTPEDLRETGCDKYEPTMPF